MKIRRIFMTAGLIAGLIHSAAMAQPAGQNTLALVGAKIYVSPDAPPIADGTVLVENGKITFVDKQDQVNLPPGIYAINCHGMVVTAGFQNSHVHFIEPKWANAATLPAAQLTTQLQQMLTRYGFTTVVDTGSDPYNTIALRKRIESGEVLGPHILTAGSPLYPQNGIPYYLSDLPQEVLKQLQQPATPKEAAADAGHMLDLGADIIKLFTGSWVTHTRILPMDPKIAAAAAEVAHRRGALVFAHMSNVAGLEIALQAHVDVAAHALENTQQLTAAHLQRMKAAHMALIPTLYLFGGNDEMDKAHLPILKEVGDYSRMGGQILFGTDVGFLTQYDPVYEYKFMERAGLDFPHVLASLTTAPAERFKAANTRGRVAAGMDADLVVLGADPSVKITNLTDVRYTIRQGRVIYSSMVDQASGERLDRKKQPK